VASFEVRPLQPNEVNDGVALWVQLSEVEVSAELQIRIRRHLLMQGSEFAALVLENDIDMVGLATLRVLSHQVQMFASYCVQWLQDRDCNVVAYYAPPDGSAGPWESAGLAIDRVRWAASR
jgi:hypothetical protein